MSIAQAAERMARAALARYLGPVAAAKARISPLGDGLINETYLVEGDHSGLPDDGLPPPPRSVLQRVNPIFDIAVHEDIEAITRHLAQKGLATPRLYRTPEGELAVEVEGQVPVEIEVEVPRVLAAGEIDEGDEAEAAEGPEDEPDDGTVTEDLASTGSQPSELPPPEEGDDGEEEDASERPDEDTSEFTAPDAASEATAEVPIPDDPDGASEDEATSEVLIPDDPDATGEADAPTSGDDDDLGAERTGEVPIPTDEDEPEAALKAAPLDGREGSAESPRGPRVRWERVKRTELRPARGVYRLSSFIPGQTFGSALSAGAGVLREGGRLVARFHEALLDMRHDFAFTRPGAHHLPTHLSTLLFAQQRPEAAAVPGFLDLSSEVAERITDHPMDAPGPLRLCHGDLKISNLRFDDAGRALCLLDLDTLSYLPLMVELGDALRSWCNSNPAAEDSPDGRFDLGLFEAALTGYADRARGFLLPEEREAIVAGVERIALELSARFAADAVNDRYFRWDPARFPSRAAHNMVRAAGQLSLARSIADQRAEAEAIVARVFRA